MSKHHVLLNRRRWSRVRRAVFQRDGYRCRACGKAGRLEADHIRPLDCGGEQYHQSNIQTLCIGCHRKKTGSENLGSPMSAEWQALISELI